MNGRAQEVYLNGRELWQHKISSWLASHEERGVLWADATLKEFLRRNQPLPSAVTYKRQTLRGRAITRRLPTSIAVEPLVAVWPEDRLVASRVALLICPLEGSADVRIGNYLLHLPEGQLCLLPPEVPRTDGSESHLISGDQSHCVLWWIKGTEHGLVTWFCVSQGAEHRHGYRSQIIISHPQARSLFNMLVHESQQPSHVTVPIQQGLIEVIFGLVLRELQSGTSVATTLPADGSTLEGHRWDPIRQARNLISENLNQHFTIDEAARLVYMSPSSFAERFRRETGETFNHYQIRMRLDRAATYLRETDWMISYIARSTGMNISHLRRLFHQHYKLSPQQYRRKMQQDGTEDA